MVVEVIKVVDEVFQLGDGILDLANSVCSVVVAIRFSTDILADSRDESLEDVESLGRLEGFIAILEVGDTVTGHTRAD